MTSVVTLSLVHALLDEGGAYRLIRKVESMLTLSDEEMMALMNLPARRPDRCRKRLTP